MKRNKLKRRGVCWDSEIRVWNFLASPSHIYNQLLCALCVSCLATFVVFLHFIKIPFQINFPRKSVNKRSSFVLLFSGNPSLRFGKPGSGVGLGYGLRFKSQLGHLQVDLAINSFLQKTIYFGFTNVSWWRLEPHIDKYLDMNFRFGAEGESSTSSLVQFFFFFLDLIFGVRIQTWSSQNSQTILVEKLIFPMVNN